MTVLLIMMQVDCNKLVNYLKCVFFQGERRKDTHKDHEGGAKDTHQGHGGGGKDMRKHKGKSGRRKGSRTLNFIVKVKIKCDKSTSKQD